MADKNSMASNYSRQSTFRKMLKREVVRNAVQASLFVGVCLNIINQGSVLWHGGDIDWGRGLLNFFVPYLVASYSAAKAQLPSA